MTKPEMLATIVKCTEKLGRVPNGIELRKHTGLTRPLIRRQFGTYSQALRACNLEKRVAAGKLDLSELFQDWAGIARKLKKVPTMVEYEDLGRFSQRPLLTRFKTWGQVPAKLKQYAEENGLASEWKDVLEMVEAQGTKKRRGARPATHRAKSGCRAKILMDRPMYGPLKTTWPLICGPTNENGVLFLFGAVAERLGYVVLRIQPEFPDSEAFRQVTENRWQRVRIEFEYESRNFLKHKHEVKECDVIVCWEHNWPECPLEVVELKKVFHGQ
jgi:Homing endonuclease associated repeat